MVLASGFRRQSLSSDIYSAGSIGGFLVNSGQKGFRKENCSVNCTWKLLKTTALQTEREGMYV